MKVLRKTCSMISIFFLCQGGHSAWADIRYRAFTGGNGRSIMGQLTRYHPGDQIATIQRDDGEIFEAHLKCFSKTDQQYIRKHGAKVNFNTLRISSKLKTVDASGSGTGRRGQVDQVKSLTYVVSLKNDSPSPFKKIEIEYCMFYWQGERHKSVMVMQHGVRHGRWQLHSMEPDARHSFKTEKVLIRKEKSTCSIFGATGGARGNVDGIWMRVTATLPNGDNLSRDILSPTLAKHHQWVPTDIPVGLNSRSRQARRP